MFFLSIGCWNMPLSQINAVMDDMNTVGIYGRIGAQNVLAHSVRNCNNTCRSLVGRTLNERGDAVPATELLGLPRAQWLQRMSRHDVGNIVHQG